MDAESVKALAKEAGADIVGIASPDRWEGSPKQMDPRYIMPEVKAVIVMGFRIFRGSLRGIEEGTFFSNYSSMGYGGISHIQMPMALWNFCKTIEDSGHEAIPLGHLSPWRAIDNEGNVSKPTEAVADDLPVPDVMIHHRIAGFCAGLGEIGYSKVFLSPEFGPRQRLGEVLTDMPLEPDPLYDGPPLCDRCMRCVTECPAGAISRTKTVKVNVAGRELEWGELDLEKCKIGLRGGEYVTDPDEKGEYLDGRSDVKPGPHTPFRNKPGNIFWHGQAICGGKGCIRACMMHLEEKGKLKNTFKQPFQRRKPWKKVWA